MATREQIIDKAAENLFRLHEFQLWINSNALWPTVPDSIRDSLLRALIDAEHELVAELWDHGSLDRAAAILRTPVPMKVQG